MQKKGSDVVITVMVVTEVLNSDAADNPADINNIKHKHIHNNNMNMNMNI